MELLRQEACHLGAEFVRYIGCLEEFACGANKSFAYVADVGPRGLLGRERDEWGDLRAQRLDDGGQIVTVQALAGGQKPTLVFGCSEGQHRKTGD